MWKIPLRLPGLSEPQRSNTQQSSHVANTSNATSHVSALRQATSLRGGDEDGEMSDSDSLTGAISGNEHALNTNISLPNKTHSGALAIPSAPSQITTHQTRPTQLADIGTRKEPVVSQKKSISVDDELAKLRARSKHFIQDWHSHGYTFDQIVSEGLDATLLASLYDELGLPVSRKPPSVSNAVQPSSRPIANTTLSTPTAARPSAAVSSSSVVAPKPQADPKPPRKPAFLVAGASSVATDPSNSTQPNEAEASAPSRQDYIARLMAAKTKKLDTPAATSSMPQSSKARSISSQKHSEKKVAPTGIIPPSSAIPKQPSYGKDGSNRTETPVTVSRSTTLQESTSEVSQSGTNLPSKAATMAEAKRRAKTALARERMAALAKNKPSDASPLLQTLPSAFSTTGVAHMSQIRESATTPSSTINTENPISTPTIAVEDRPLSPSLAAVKVDQAAPKTVTLVDSNGGTPIPARIPGLSTTSSGRQTPEISSTTNSASYVHQRGNLATESAESSDTAAAKRKRPIAADFIDEPYRPAKRSFGPARNVDDERMVIEVSDDEDIIMGSTNAATLAASPRKRVPGKDFDKPFASKASSTAMLGGPARPQLDRTVSPREDHKQKQVEILEMKKKIAALELKRRRAKTAARGAATSSMAVDDHSIVVAEQDPEKDSAVEVPEPETTKQPVAIETHAQDSLTSITAAYHHQSQPEKPVVKAALPQVSQADTESYVDTSTSNPVGAAQSTVDGLLTTKSNPVPQQTTSSVAGMDGSEWRTRRRTEIRSGLPLIEASYASNTSKLEALKAQMKEIEVAMRREEEDRQRLVAELESLGVDTEGMNHGELQDTKDEIMARADSDGPTATDREVAAASMPTVDAASQTSATSMSISSPEQSISEQDDHFPAVSDGDGGLEQHTDRTVTSPTQEVHDRPAVGSAVVLQKTPEALVSHSPVLPLVTTAKAEPSADELDDEDSITSGDVSMDEDSTSESEADSGEVSSTNASPNHDVLQDQAKPSKIVLPATTEPNGLPATYDARSAEHTSHEESDDDSEMYEPPEPTSVEDISESIPNEPLHHPSESEHSAAEGIVRQRTTNSEDGEIDSDEEYDPTEPLPSVAVPVIEEVPAAPVQRETKADDSGLRPATSDSEADTPAAGPADTTTVAPMLPNQYTPYRSAIRDFKAYRFHPDFTATVPGGIRSTTYTHKIDAKTPWCQFEAAGGVCNDPKCEDQHMRSMIVEDVDLVNQLGLSNPGRNPQERETYNKGLRQLLVDVQANNVNSTVDEVAAEITAYRRKFMQDPSRILAL